MSSGNLTFQIIVDSNGAVQGLDQVEKAMKRASNSVRNLQNQSQNVTNQLGRQARASNLAGQSALEVSRIASDAAYGFRGMANNIGQVSTMLVELSTQMDETGKKALGFRGALNAIGHSLLGPMGLIVAIQSILAAIQLWQDHTRRQAKEQEKLNEEIDKTRQYTRDFRGDLASLITIYEGATGAYKEYLGVLLRDQIPMYDKLIAQGENVYDLAIDLEYAKQMELKTSKELAEEADGQRRNSLAVIAIQERLTEWTAKRLRLEFKLNGLKEKEGDSDRDREKAQILDTESRAYESLIEAIQSRVKSEQNADKAIKRSFAERQRLAAIELDQYYQNLEKKAEAENAGQEVITQIQEEYMTARLALMQKFANDAANSARFIASNGGMFGNDGLSSIATFAEHIDAASASVMYLGETFGNLSRIGDEQNKKLFRLQQAFAIASVTMDTIVAVAKVQAKTPLLGQLMTAAIIARGVAQVSAIATQKLDGSSKLRGATGAVSAVNRDDSIPVVTTGFSNLEGGERPGESIRVYVTDHDLRTTRDRSNRTKVRARL